jgi:hypothetical protein
VSRATTVAFVGTQRWTVTLAKGTYRYVCDPHASLMKGALTVTENTTRKTKVSRFQARRSGRQAVVSVRVDQAVKAKVELMRGSKVVSRVSARLRPGMNVKRLRARSAGRHVVRLVLMDGSKRTFKRTIRF